MTPEFWALATEIWNCRLQRFGVHFGTKNIQGLLEKDGWWVVGCTQLKRREEFWATDFTFFKLIKIFNDDIG